MIFFDNARITKNNGCYFYDQDIIILDYAYSGDSRIKLKLDCIVSIGVSDEGVTGYEVAVCSILNDELTYDLDERKKNTLIQSLTYFGHQVGQNLFALYYEVKVNDCLDINSDNFSHVLLPKPKTDDEQYIVQHLSDKLVELGVKPVLYVRNDTIQLEQDDNVKKVLENMEINKVVTNLISNNEVKVVNNFQYQNLDLDGVGNLKNNEIANNANTKRHKMK